MERKTTYTINEDMALALKKVIGHISDVDFDEKFKLSAIDTLLVHRFYDEVTDLDGN